MERDFKTEPGSQDYAGQYNFGHSGDNPISTGNGYANALLGVFTSYNERNERIDRDERHWYGGFYAQDSWRLTSRLTLDYGFRMEHHGAVYEARDENSGFDPALWSASNQPVIYRPACKTGVPGNQACSSAQPGRHRPAVPGPCSLNRALIGTVVPGVGSIANGQWTNGLANHPTNPDSGKKDGWYYDYPMWSYAPRVGLAWDVFGDGKTAIRASTGVFYNFVNRNTYGFSGGALVSRVRTITNSTLNDLAAAVAAGNFVESPQNTRIPPGFGLTDSTATSCRRASSSRNATTTSTSRSSATSASTPSPKSRTSRTSGGSTGATRPSTTSRSTPTPIRTTCSTAKPSPRTSCGGTTRAWAASAT